MFVCAHESILSFPHKAAKWGACLLALIVFCSPLQAEHGLSVFGDLKYPADFKYFDYVNPDAPKGGLVNLDSFLGTFDSLNPYILKGTPAAGTHLLHCTLLEPSADEPASSYAYLAEDVQISEDRSLLTFTLNPKATFTDGSKVTADDVVFSFQTLKEKGAPFIALYLRDVDQVKALGPLKVQFHLTNIENRSLPLILAGLPIFSKAFYTKHDFAKADLTVPVGCGPYTISDIQAGHSLTYILKKDWWGVDLPSQKGRHNFDMTYQYYRDQAVLMEAFKSGETDFRSENIAKNWASAYDFPAFKKGLVIREEIPQNLPATLQYFVFNTRNPLFQDVRVREALQYAFDFEWMNKNLFYNTYKRSESFFSNSPMAATGLPQGEELALLETYKDKLRPEIFEKPFGLPKTKGDGNVRSQISQANKLLVEAGWIIKDGVRVNAKTGQPFAFEVLTYDPVYEKVLLSLQRGLKSLGIAMTIRSMTPAQYIERVENFEYDMINIALPTSDTPGNELLDFWSSKKADVRGTHNLPGVKNPIVDDLIELILKADTRDSLNQRVRALDRVLLWNFYGLLNWYAPNARIAYWDKFGMPSKKPRDGIGFDTWWIDDAKAKKLRKG